MTADHPALAPPLQKTAKVGHPARRTPPPKQSLDGAPFRIRIDAKGWATRLSEDDLSEIKAGRKRLYLFGQTRYTNSTDSVVHTTRFCSYAASAGANVVNGVATEVVVMVGCHGPWSYAD